jgi:hypothetical protein
MGHWNRFAPSAYFGNPKGMLPENVRSHIILGANHKRGENTRIGIDLNQSRIISHGSRFTPLKVGLSRSQKVRVRILHPSSLTPHPGVALPKTKATLLLFCHSKVRVASGVINCPLALRTADTVLRVSRLGLVVQLPGDALETDMFLY